MPVNRVSAQFKFGRETIERRAAGAQKLDAPAFIVTAYLAARFVNCRHRFALSKASNRPWQAVQ